MILGTGIDLCEQIRIERALERFGERFIKRICSENEIIFAEKKPLKRVSRYAQLFAAKEACAKALGTGFRQGVFWRNLELIPLPSGKPSLRFSGGALKKLEEITPKGMTAKLDISLTDEAGLTFASVIISAVTKQ